MLINFNIILVAETNIFKIKKQLLKLDNYHINCTLYLFVKVVLKCKLLI